jgi:hypothetical protein
MRVRIDSKRLADRGRVPAAVMRDVLNDSKIRSFSSLALRAGLNPVSDFDEEIDLLLVSHDGVDAEFGSLAVDDLHFFKTASAVPPFLIDIPAFDTHRRRVSR